MALCPLADPFGLERATRGLGGPCAGRRKPQRGLSGALSALRLTQHQAGAWRDAAIHLAALEAAHPDVVARFKYEQPGSRRFLVKAPPKQAQEPTREPTHPPTQAPAQKPPQEPLEKAQGALTSDAVKRGEHPPPGTTRSAYNPRTAHPRTAHPRTAHECTAHEVTA